MYCISYEIRIWKNNFNTVVGDYINVMKTTFYLNLNCCQAFYELQVFRGFFYISLIIINVEIFIIKLFA